MVKNGVGQEGNIKTFLRVRPSKKPSGFFQRDEHDGQRLRFVVPVDYKPSEVGAGSGARWEGGGGGQGAGH